MKSLNNTRHSRSVESNASPKIKQKAAKEEVEGLNINKPPSPCKTFVSWGACHITLDWAGQKRRIKSKPEA